MNSRSFLPQVAHDTNTVKRLVDQARDSYYALYRLLLVTEADREPRLSLLQCFIHMPDAFNEEERAIIRLVRDFARENKPESLCIWLHRKLWNQSQLLIPRDNRERRRKDLINLESVVWLRFPFICSWKNGYLICAVVDIRSSCKELRASCFCKGVVSELNNC